MAVIGIRDSSSSSSDNVISSLYCQEHTSNTIIFMNNVMDHPSDDPFPLAPHQHPGPPPHPITFSQEYPPHPSPLTSTTPSLSPRSTPLAPHHHPVPPLHLPPGAPPSPRGLSVVVDSEKTGPAPQWLAGPVSLRYTSPATHLKMDAPSLSSSVGFSSRESWSL